MFHLRRASASEELDCVEIQDAYSKMANCAAEKANEALNYDQEMDQLLTCQNGLENYLKASSRTRRVAW